MIHPNDIADLFAKKYKDVYNCVPSDMHTMQGIEDVIMHSIKDCEHADAIVTLNDVNEAMARIKANKGDGDKGLLSNHLIFAGDALHMQLSGLFTAIFSHGYMPKSLVISTIISIPKDYTESLSDSNNYRGIALSSSIGKLFDWIYLKRNADKLDTSSLQFAFKPKLGTTMCTLTLKEVITHYMNNQSDVFSCFIDASKAFDRIRHDQLFTLLIERQVSAMDIRILMNQYKHQKIRTTWKGSMSETFTAMNGIRQGSVASPTLFCIYLDELIKRLQRLGVGCWFGDKYVGSLAYADDLTLTCPSADGLQQMVQVCEEFGEQYGMQFNPKKSVCIVFTKKKRVSEPQIILSGQRLKWVKEVKHLGNWLSTKLDEQCEIKMKRNNFIIRVNQIIANFGSVKEETKLKVFQSQCCDFYGCQAWRFSDNWCDSYHKLYNRSVRRLLNLPYATHTRFLQVFTKMPLSEDTVFNRFIKIYKSMACNTNEVVRLVARSNCENKMTIIGGNISLISKKFGYDVGITHKKRQYTLSTEDVSICKAIEDARGRDIDFFDLNEIELFIYQLCVN